MSKTFIQTLADLNLGAVALDLDEGLTEVLEAVDKTRSKGSIELKLTFKVGKGNRKIVVDPAVKVKPPKFEQPSDYFFMGKDLSLQRNDPDQAELPLIRSVEPEDNNSPVIDPETGEVLSPARAQNKADNA